MLKPVTRGKQLWVRAKLIGYGTQKRVSYEVQPTKCQELANRYYGGAIMSGGSTTCTIIEELLYNGMLP
jgi:hypothetical protein